MSEKIIETYVRLLLERRMKQAHLSRHRISDWGSDDHINDLESRCADAAYWRDKYPRGSEKRSHYRNIYAQLRKELQSAKKANQLNEYHESPHSLLNEYVSMVLNEVIQADSSTQEVQAPASDPAKKQVTMYQKAKNLGKIALDLDSKLFTGAARYIPELNKKEHWRITTRDPYDLENLELYSEEIIKKSLLNPFNDKAIVNSKFIGKSESEPYSGKYPVYKVTVQDPNDSNNIVTYMILFNGTREFGSRSGGVEYENKTIERVRQSISKEYHKSLLDVTEGSATKSDLYINYGRGKKVGIEVKALNPRFGEPTVYVRYFEKQEQQEQEQEQEQQQQQQLDFTFVPSSTLLSTKLITSLLNSDKNLLKGWINKFNHLRKDDGLLKKIRKNDWESMKGAVSGSSNEIEVPIINVAYYYQYKRASYIQIQDKGLYAFLTPTPVPAEEESFTLPEPPVLSIKDEESASMSRLNIPDFVQKCGNLKASIQLKVLPSSSGDFVIRAAISVDFNGLKKSEVDLDEPLHIMSFMDELDVSSTKNVNDLNNYK